MKQDVIDPSTPHPDYCEIKRKHEICEDSFSGQVSPYVERLNGQTEAERADYVGRAAYFNVVQPTVTSLIGALTRKPYQLIGSEFPASDFGSIDTFLQVHFKNLFLGGRTFVLVTVENGSSKLVTYDADDVINWCDEFVVIKEEMLVRNAKNPFKLETACFYREHYLDEAGLYRSRRWVEKARGKWVAEELPALTVNGQLLTYIPLFIANPFDNTWEPVTPPLFTQSSLNIQHFKQNCDLAHYAHFMALPTPVIVGNIQTLSDGDGGTITQEVHIGSTKQILHLTEGSKFEYGEVSGNSFKMLQDELGKIEERMFISGSRLITNKSGVESAAALQLRAGGETATLETLTNSLEGMMNEALALCSEIDRSAVAIQLNKDFTSAVADPATIKSLLELYLAKVISLDQFLDRLYHGEVVAPLETPSIN